MKPDDKISNPKSETVKPEKSEGEDGKELFLIYSLCGTLGFDTAEAARLLSEDESEIRNKLEKAKKQIREENRDGPPAAGLFDFNLAYCDEMVSRVMKKIEEL